MSTLTDPASGNPLNSPGHAALHTAVNEAIRLIEARLGIDADGAVGVSSSSAPSAPSSGIAKLFNRDIAGRQMLAMASPSGQTTPLQAFLARNRIAWWSAVGNSAAAPAAVGATALTTLGTLTARNVATGSLLSSMRRVGLVSAATAASFCSWRLAALQFWRGNAAGLGGFFLVTRFAVSDAVLVSGARMFVGLRASSVAPSDGDASALTNIIGVGKDASDTNLQVVYNDASGAASKVDLGASFAINITDPIELALFAAANGGDVSYRVENLATGAVATGTLTTDLPASTTLLTPNCYRSNGAAGSAAVALDFMNLYVETDA